MFFLIDEALKAVQAEEIRNSKKPYVAILSRTEWEKSQDQFDMGIEIEPDESEILITKAEVNYDSITGAFSVPNRKDFSQDDATFAFALDEKGVVFIDDSGAALKIVRQIENTKRWRLPSLERFLYDFMDQIIAGDQQMMARYERELDDMEDAIIHDKEGVTETRVNKIRGDIRDLRNHYEQMLDVAEVFEENENHFFSAENLRYFRLYANRIERLIDASTAIRDYTMQIRDLYKTHLDVKQNNIMTVLTVVTTIFMPLTLIVGWYGMNFRYMPELGYKWSYPILILVSLLIVVGNILFFKRKKWL